MRPIAIAIAVAVAVLCLLAACGSSPPPPREPRRAPAVTTTLPSSAYTVTELPDGTVRITTTVNPVAVYVDGVPIGNAPIEIRPSGVPIHIELRKDGY
jgi:hypothetical protein